MSKYWSLTLVMVLATGLAAKKKEIPPDPALEATTARGRALADYMNAAQAGRKAVGALQPAKGSVTHYFALKSDSGWTVIFGRYNGTGDKFLVVYEAEQGDSLEEFRPRFVQPPREDTGDCLHAAHAIDTATKDFNPPQRYDVAVLSGDTGQWYVYLFPAQTQPGVYFYGGDFRYLISLDGTSIVEKRQLHKSILSFKDSNTRRGAKTAGGWHTHILSDIPEDTDVSLVLLRKPSGPETVGCSKQVFTIETDGTIRRTK